MGSYRRPTSASASPSLYIFHTASNLDSNSMFISFLLLLLMNSPAGQLGPTRWLAFLDRKKNAFDDFGVNSRWLCDVVTAGVVLQSGSFLARNQPRKKFVFFFFFRLGSFFEMLMSEF